MSYIIPHLKKKINLKGIKSAAAFAGLGAGVSDLFSHIEQINSGLPANWGRILKDLVMILVPAFFVALPLMLL